MANNTRKAIDILIKENWETIIAKMQAKYNISDVSFRTWIRPMVVYACLNDNKIVVWLSATGNKNLIQKFVTGRYKNPLEETIREIYSTSVTIFFVVTSDTLDEEELERVMSAGAEYTLPHNPLFTSINHGRRKQ